MGSTVWVVSVKNIIGSRASTTPDARLVLLRYWRRLTFGNAILTKPRAPSDSNGNPVSTLPRVDIERFRAELSEAGVEEMLGPLLTTFAEDAPARFAALEQAVQRGDAKAVETAAHAYKSGAGTVHATVLAAELANAESAARRGDLETIIGLIEQMRGEHHAVLRELETILAIK